MKTNRKRLCRRMLMLVMVLGFFLGFRTTVVAGDTPINNVAIYGITTPRSGDKPRFQATLITGSNYHFATAQELRKLGWDDTSIESYVNGVSWWYDNGVISLYSTDTFEPDKNYYFAAALLPNNGYTFSDTLNITMNGSKDMARIYSKDGSLLLVASTCFSTAATPITTVDISGITLPLANQKADFEGILPAAANYRFATKEELIKYKYKEEVFTNGIAWRHYIHDRYMTPEDTFSASSYWFSAVLVPYPGYKFADNVTCTINRDANLVNSKKIYIEKTNLSFISKDFEVHPPISYTNVYSITKPVAGQKPDFEGSLHTNAHCHFASRKELVDSNYYLWEDYYVNGIAWLDLATGDLLTEDSVFVEEHEYQLQVVLIPDSEYIFEDNAEGAINYDKDLVGEQYSRGTDYYFHSIPLKAAAAPTTKITEVKISGVPTPVAGQLCSTNGITVTTFPADAADVTEIYWYDETDGSWISSKESFMNGHTYHICFVLNPVTNYKFQFDDASAEMYKPYIGTVTINDKEAGGAEERFTDGSELFIFGKSEFVAASGTTTEKSITEADVFGITLPAAGETPSYEVTLAADAEYESAKKEKIESLVGKEIADCSKNGVVWFEETSTGEKPMSPNAKFVGGKNYRVVVFLVSRDGFMFGALKSGSINGKPELYSKEISYVYDVATLGFSSVSMKAVASGSGTLPPPVEGGNGTTKLSYKVTKEDADGNGTITITGSAENQTELTSITIPDTVIIGGKTFTVTAIGANAFKNYTKLTTVTIGKNVDTIGANAFKNCKALTKIVIGNKVISIGNSSFEDCSLLKTVIVGKNLKTIGKKAFKNCKKLISMRFKGTKLKKVGANAFKGIHAKCKIKVPKKKVKAYKALFLKKGQAKTVKISK